jgi:asparagine synthase (glutamine-hydrolysing)
LHIRQRPKRGFEMPVDEWLRGPLRDLFRDEVLAPQTPLRDFINPAVAQEAFDAHCSGRENHRTMLWSLLMLAHWAKQYLHSPTSASSTDERVTNVTDAGRTP